MQPRCLVVPAKSDIGPIVVAEFERLMPRNGNRDGDSYTGVRLLGEWVLYSVHACFPTKQSKE